MSPRTPDDTARPIPGFPDYAIQRDGTVLRITSTHLNGRTGLPPEQWVVLAPFSDYRHDPPAPARRYSRFVMLCRAGSRRGLKRSVGKLLRETWGEEAEREWLHTDTGRKPPPSDE